MRTLYPSNIMMVRYEDMIRSPKATMLSILEFMNINTSGVRMREAIEFALEMSSADQMRALEARRGRRLSGIVQGASGSHLSDGGIGKWRNRLSREDVDVIERELAAFGISTSEFVFE